MVCLSTCTVCLFICLSITALCCLSASLFMCPSNEVPSPSVSLSTCCVCLPAYLSVCLSVRPSLCPSVCLSVRPAVYLSVCLSVRPSVCLSVCMYVRLSVSLSNHTSSVVSTMVTVVDNCPLQSTLCVLTLIRCPFHPRVTAAARKRPRSICQKCRW